MDDKPAAPLVCVIISTMNAAAHLQECLDSIYAQSLQSWEIIIIDGGSRDGTIEVIRRNEMRLHYWLSEPDTGVYDAWNKALPQVTADWIVFLGADDFLNSSGVLSKVASTLQAFSGRVSIVYGKVAFIDDSGAFIREEGNPWAMIADRFKREMCIPHQGVFHHRTLFANGWTFDTSFRYAGDYDLLLGEVLHTPPFFLDYCVANWRQGGLTTDPGNSIQVLLEFRRVRAKHRLRGRHPRWVELKGWIKYFLSKTIGSGLASKVLYFYRKLTK